MHHEKALTEGKEIQKSRKEERMKDNGYEYGRLRVVHTNGLGFGFGLAGIRENLFWAFSYNLFAIPLAVSGRIHPILSAAFMLISSLSVISNSLRLYRVK